MHSRKIAIESVASDDEYDIVEKHKFGDKCVTVLCLLSTEAASSCHATIEGLKTILMKHQKKILMQKPKRKIKIVHVC